MQDLLNRNAGALSLLALVVALAGACIAGANAAGVLVGGKQIKNGSITARDLHKNSVRSKAIQNGAVQSPEIGSGQVHADDIGADQVTARALSLPSPAQVVLGPSTGPVGPDFGALVKVATYDKASADSVLRVNWNGVAANGAQTNCIFQIRVNGQAPQNGGGEVFALSNPVNVSTSALFPSLGAGAVSVEVWARYTFKMTSSPTCVLNPEPNPGINSTFVISEDVT